MNETVTKILSFKVIIKVQHCKSLQSSYKNKILIAVKSTGIICYKDYVK